MERRFAQREQEIIGQARIPPGLFRGILDRLALFAEPYLALLRREGQRAHAQIYIEGLVSDLERKNIESIAYRYDQDRMNLQRFIGWSAWDHAPLMAELARQVGDELGEPDGVLAFDPSGFKKCGRDSVGVQRQWLGRLGKVDNGQVAVYLGYVSRGEYALVATRLFLPRDWARDRKRRKKAGVPREIRFRTRHELALEMLAEYGGTLPHEWITGDDEMGRSTRCRGALRALDEHYLLNVPSNPNIRDLEAEPPAYRGRGPRPKPPFERVDQWAAALSKGAWTRIEVRDGEKGPLRVDIVKRRVVARTESRRKGSTEEMLVVVRSPDENGKVKHDYSLSNAPLETPLKELARVEKAEHRIEDCLRRAKSEAGLADYEVRNWVGWHHHQVLSLLATWFLTLEKRRGEKEGAGDHGPADSCRPCLPVARGLHA